MAPLSRHASGCCPSGPRPIPTRSTTRSCSGGRSCRGSRPRRFPRSWRRPVVQGVRVRLPTGEADAACFGVEDARRAGWHQPLKTHLSTDGESSHSPPDQPRFRPPLLQGDKGYPRGNAANPDIPGQRVAARNPLGRLPQPEPRPHLTLAPPSDRPSGPGARFATSTWLWR